MTDNNETEFNWASTRDRPDMQEDNESDEQTTTVDKPMTSNNRTPDDDSENERGDSEPTPVVEVSEEEEENEEPETRVDQTEENSENVSDSHGGNSTDNPEKGSGVSEENDSVEPGSDDDIDIEESDEETEFEEIVPELHSDVYRRPFEGYDVKDIEDLADAVGEIDRQASITIEQLIRRVAELEQNVSEYKKQAKQAQKEFQNFKQRKNAENEQIKETAAKDFIKEILPLRDNLERALEHDTEDIRGGVELIRDEFDELLKQEGVTIIEPEAGESLDPSVHEVMTRVESSEEEGKIVDCYRPGYSMEDLVIRPARVTVSDGVEESTSPP